jgi:hypothetical protein
LIAPNGEKSNLNKQQWAQVRTPQFKEYYGDWEAEQRGISSEVASKDGATSNTRTARASETGYDSRNRSDNKGGAKVQRREPLTVGRVRFDDNGVVHGFQHSGAPTVKAVAGIKSLIENAAKIATNPHEPVNENIKQVHTLVAPLSIDGELFSVKITAKEYWDGSVKLYDHQTLEMKKPSGIYESTPDKSGSILRPALGNVSIEQLLSAFNGENTKYLASKVVDANGEPILVSLVE